MKSLLLSIPFLVVLVSCSKNQGPAARSEDHPKIYEVSAVFKRTVPATSTEPEHEEVYSRPAAASSLGQTMTFTNGKESVDIVVNELTPERMNRFK